MENINKPVDEAKNDSESKAYQEGKKASLMGGKISDNPYHFMKIPKEQWRNGFLDAKFK